MADAGIQLEAFREQDFAKRWSLSPTGKYFNSGMILVDLNRFRIKRIMPRTIAILEQSHHLCGYGDQDALNVVLWNDWLPLDPQWNFQREYLLDTNAFATRNPDHHDPIVIHFSGTYSKPWVKSETHPYAWLYVRSLCGTPFRDEVLVGRGQR